MKKSKYNLLHHFPVIMSIKTRGKVGNARNISKVNVVVGGGWWCHWYERVIVRVRLRWFHLFVNLFRGRLSRPFQISFLFCICYVCKCRYMY